MNKNIKNALMLYGLQGVNVIYPLIVIPFLASGLGAARLGDFLSHQALALIYFAFVNYGFNYSATKEAAIKIAAGEEVRDLFATIYSCKLYIVLFCVVVSFPLAYFTKMEFCLMAAFFPMLIGTAIFPIWYFQAKQKMHLIAGPHIIAKILSLGLIYVFVSSAKDIYLAAIIVAATYLISGFSSMLVMRGSEDAKYSIVGPKKVIRQLIKDRHLAVGVILTGLYVNFGLVVVGALGAVSGNILSAIGVGMKIKNGFPAVVQPVSQIIYPKASSYYSRYGKLPHWMVRVLVVQLLAILLVCGLVVIFSNSMAQILIKESDSLVSHYIILFSICGAVSLIRNVIYVQVLSSKGLDALYSKVSVLQFPFFLVVMLATVPLVGWGYSIVVAYLAVDVVAVVAAGVFLLSSKRSANERKDY